MEDLDKKKELRSNQKQNDLLDEIPVKGAYIGNINVRRVMIKNLRVVVIDTGTRDAGIALRRGD